MQNVLNYDGGQSGKKASPEEISKCMTEALDEETGSKRTADSLLTIK